MIGICNVLIAGLYSGSIVFDGETIFEVYKQGQPLPEGVEWIDGQGCEFCTLAGINPHVHDRPRPTGKRRCAALGSGLYLPAV